MTAVRRIIAFLESRSTYGYAKNVLVAMKKESEIEASCLVTGMHLIPELGKSVDLIRADGFPIAAEVPMAPVGNGRGAWSRALGGAIADYADALDEADPDMVILFGDRAETFGCCVAASYMGLPIAHVQAGDKSGHIDDLARMAIAKLAHIHLASCEDSAERLRRLGEQDFRIFDVGAPQLDDIVEGDFSRAEIEVGGQRIPLDRPYLLLMQHPLMVESNMAGEQAGETIRACRRTGLPVVWIHSNSDLGFRHILDASARHAGNDVKVLANAERDDFLTLMANCAVLVGNSSAGILEAPSLHVPVVNVGDRQRGRIQASNIINCAQSEDEIHRAVQRALEDEDFLGQCKRAVNPYGDGKSGERIARVLAEIPIDRKLLDKETVY